MICHILHYIYIYVGILAIKKGNLVICNNMDGLRRYAKWNIRKEANIRPHLNVESLKKLKEYLARRYREQVSGCRGRGLGVAQTWVKWAKRYNLHVIKAVMGASLVVRGSESTCNAGNRRFGFHPWVWKIPWRRIWQPTPVFLPGKFHGQRSLEGYSPWGCKESDMTEQWSTHVHSHPMKSLHMLRPAEML